MRLPEKGACTPEKAGLFTTKTDSYTEHSPTSRIDSDSYTEHPLTSRIDSETSTGRARDDRDPRSRAALGPRPGDDPGLEPGPSAAGRPGLVRSGSGGGAVVRGRAGAVAAGVAAGGAGEVRRDVLGGDPGGASLAGGGRGWCAPRSSPSLFRTPGPVPAHRAQGPGARDLKPAAGLLPEAIEEVVRFPRRVRSIGLRAGRIRAGEWARVELSSFSYSNSKRLFKII
jgi:hypothetical protein